MRLVLRFAPSETDPRSSIVAAFALEARKQRGDAVFWKVYEDLVRAPALQDADLAAIAKKRGVDWTKAQAAIKAGVWKKAIEHDVQVAATAKATTRLAVFVNGYQVRQAYTSLIWKRVAHAVAATKKP